MRWRLCNFVNMLVTRLGIMEYLITRELLFLNTIASNPRNFNRRRHQIVSESSKNPRIQTFSRVSSQLLSMFFTGFLFSKNRYSREYCDTFKHDSLIHRTVTNISKVGSSDYSQSQNQR